MPGNYHIIHERARVGTRQVPRPDSRGRTRMQSEETLETACGVTLVDAEAGQSCCSITIANPSWSHNWCHDCVRVFARTWTEKQKAIWRSKGIDLEEDVGPTG